MSREQTGLEAVDVGARPTPLYAYEFIGVAGSATLTGFFTDFSGRQCSVGVTITITDAAGSTFADAVGIVSSSAVAIPSQARGFEGVLSADCYQGKAVPPTGILPAELPQSGYPIVPAGTYIIWGRSA